MMKSLVGHRNGRLLVVDRAPGAAADGHSLWICKCDCGETCIVQSNNIKRPTGTKSCGCLNREHCQNRAGGSGWNTGQTYAIQRGGRIYKTKRAWALAILRIKGNKCERCGWDKAPCDIHHKIPRSQGGKNTIDNGSVLCPNCHRVEHFKLSIK